MEIDIRKGGICGHATWREVRIKESGTTINFDVSEGNELNSFRETILDAVFGDMSMDEVVKYLTERAKRLLSVTKTRNQKPPECGFFMPAYQQRFTSLYRYAITHNIRNHP